MIFIFIARNIPGIIVSVISLFRLEKAVNELRLSLTMYMQPILDGWANMVITAPCRRLFNCLHAERHESSASAMELRHLLYIYMGSPMTRVVNNGWTSRINDNGQKWSVGIQRTFVGAERRGPSALAMELRHLYAAAYTVTCKRIPTWSYIACLNVGRQCYRAPAMKSSILMGGGGD